MPSDYDAIRKDNIRKYGEETRHLELLSRLYTDRTHFIFELLQNSEDARAQTVRFHLRPDRLELRHDGRPFDEHDVVGICGVVESTKAKDLTQIGKFGIGFKSVYAYTSNPEIHSGDEHFRIESYVRPHGVPGGKGPVERETLFVFPFDRGDPSAATASTEIADALNELDLGTLLFLRHVQRIECSGHGVFEAVLERRSEPDGAARRVELIEQSETDARQREDWLVFDRTLIDVGHPEQRVELAFRLVANEKGVSISALSESRLVVFFPTDKETHLGFRMQGPYRTTPARDNIPAHDEENRALVEETAKLLRAVLPDLRDRGLLGVDALEAMPIVPNHFPPGSMLEPLYQTVRDALLEDDLVPLAAGGFANARRVKLARSGALRSLLSEQQLAALFGAEAAPFWVTEQVSERRALWRYLQEELGVGVVDPERFLILVTTEFLVAQTDEWMIRFYTFLAETRALWSPPIPGRQPGLARTRTIIRLEDGRHVAPFDASGSPRVWLPGEGETEFPTVRATLAADAAARQFLKDLGLSEPDVVAEVTETVLPRYAGANVAELDDVQHRFDLERIAHALAIASPDKRTRLRQRLQATAFLRASNAATQEAALRTPTSCYWREPDLETYFAGNTSAWFLDDAYREWFEPLKDLGARDAVRMTAGGKRTPQGTVILVAQHSNHARGLDGFDSSFTIDGLEYALSHPEVTRSAYVWNTLLVPYRHYLRGIVERSSRQDYFNATRSERLSPAGELATNLAWLPGSDGSFQSPGKLELDDLPPQFQRHDALAKALGMVTPALQEASRELGISAALLLHLKDHPGEVRKLEQAYEAFRRSVGEESEGSEDDHDRTDGVPPPEVDFVDGLLSAFGKPGRDLVGDGPTVGESSTSSGEVRNPELRRDRVRAEIDEAQDVEPARGQRFRKVPRRVLEAKDSSVRQFLTEQYQGRCQICDDGFLKRGGLPYFEGLYLVPRARARWLDRPGNVVALCPMCCAKFQHGQVEADDVLDQILRWRTRQEGVSQSDDGIRLVLCEEEVCLRFTEKHFLDLQEMVLASTEERSSEADTDGN